MPYVAFYQYFPEIAKRETRAITILRRSEMGLPAGHYSFFESFCDEPDCDCRRVFFSVVSSVSEEIEAVIAYGWESLDFYANWMGDGDPRTAIDLRGPVLNLSSPQSNLAPAILDLVKQVLLRDDAYIERVKQHYKIFRNRIDKKSVSKIGKKKKTKTKRKKRKK